MKQFKPHIYAKVKRVNEPKNLISFNVVKLDGAQETHYKGLVIRTDVGTFKARRLFGSGLEKEFQNNCFPINELETLYKALRWACNGFDSLSRASQL